MTTLLEAEKNMVALGLLGIVDRQKRTPDLAPIILRIADKLGVREHLIRHAVSWLQHASPRDRMSHPIAYFTDIARRTDSDA